MTLDEALRACYEKVGEIASQAAFERTGKYPPSMGEAINSGFCKPFAEMVCAIGRASGQYLTSVVLLDECQHYVIYSGKEDRYYDAEDLDGVEDETALKSYQRAIKLSLGRFEAS